MYKHILIPTDGSDLSRAAALNGVKLARALGARVTAFFAAPAATPLVYQGILPVGYTTPERHAEMIEKTAAKYLGVIEKACEKAGVPFRGVHATNEFPADAIMAAAAKYKCDLIFMASHGRRGIAGVLLGSETQKVLTHSKIPVLVYR
ncbi:MAG: universal stress protein [Burkholderiales bacterium]|nr:universal stress protein [Burkholderiales bacterium]